MGGASLKIAWGAETATELAIWVGDYSDVTTPSITNAKAVAKWNSPVTLLDMAVSPDGQSLAVLATDVLPPGAEGLLPNWLSVINLNTNAVQSIPDYDNKDLYEEFYSSPPFRIIGWLDNTKLAVQQMGEGPVIAKKDGTYYSRLLFQPGTSPNTALSPDRKTFFSTLVNNGVSAWQYDIDGSNPHQVLGNNSFVRFVSPNWSPDGKYISFLSANSELRNETLAINTIHIRLLELSAFSQKDISEQNEDLWDVAPVWSVDSSKLAFLRADAAVTGSAIPYDMPEKLNTNIYVASMNDLIAHKLTSFDTVRNKGLQWTPGGNLVLSSTSGSANGLLGLVAVSTVDGTAISLLGGSSGESLVHPLIFSR